MTSKEALKYIILGTNVDTHRSSIEEIDEAIETIEKDLEVLEIIKNNEISISYIEQSTSYDDYISKCGCFRNLSYTAEEEYTKLKEWLENDKRRIENNIRKTSKMVKK